MARRQKYVATRSTAIPIPTRSHNTVPDQGVHATNMESLLCRLQPNKAGTMKITWATLASGFGPSYHGFPAWMLLLLAAGVFVSGVRDLMASARPATA